MGPLLTLLFTSKVPTRHLWPGQGSRSLVQRGALGKGMLWTEDILSLLMSLPLRVSSRLSGSQTGPVLSRWPYCSIQESCWDIPDGGLCVEVTSALLWLVNVYGQWGLGLGLPRAW